MTNASQTVLKYRMKIEMTTRLRKLPEREPEESGKLPTPAEIVANLNDHVIGQEQAKKALAVSVYNHLQTPAPPESRS